MEVSRIRVNFLEPLQLVILFQNNIFHLLELNVLCIKVMKGYSIGINWVKDVFLLRFMALFFIHHDLLEDITKFLLGPCIKGTKHPFQFLVKFPHSIAFHLLFRASFQSFHVKRIVNLEINEYEVPNVIIFF